MMADGNRLRLWLLFSFNPSAAGSQSICSLSGVLDNAGPSPGTGVEGDCNDGTTGPMEGGRAVARQFGGVSDLFAAE
jgi:hypothetical protein